MFLHANLLLPRLVLAVEVRHGSSFGLYCYPGAGIVTSHPERSPKFAARRVALDSALLWGYRRLAFTQDPWLKSDLMDKRRSARSVRWPARSLVSAHGDEVS